MKFVAVVFAAIVLISAGVFQASQSWGRTDAAVAEVVQAKLSAIPLSGKEWVGEDVDYDAKQLKQTQAIAHVHRVYKNAKTGEAISVLILAGDSREIGAHDPERCYDGAGYRPVGQRLRREMLDPTTAKESSYWSARFDTDTFPAVSLQVNWAWTLDGIWMAAEEARTEFVGQSVLYKMYATRRLVALDNAQKTNDTTEQFFVEFLPAVRKAIAGN